MKAFIIIGAAACLAACGSGDNAPVQESVETQPAAPAAPGFGQTVAEREAAAKRGLGDRWVKTDSATEHSSPGGPVVNRVYYGQKFTIYEERNGWVRTVEDGFDARWSRASDLSDTQPPAKPEYAGDPATADARIHPDAIPNPGEYGLTRRDVDTIRKGAKLVLQSRPDCAEITVADKSVSKPNTYYVTCRIGGTVQNVFFTRAEVDAARLD